MERDIKQLNVPNVCFSLTEKNDDREVQYKKQRIERGFDDSETWCLSATMANFMLPRLKRYKVIIMDVLNESELINDVECVILGLEMVLKENNGEIITDEEIEIINNGLKKLSEIFMGLWW